MNNSTEVERKLKNAEVALSDAERNFKFSGWLSATEVCTEETAKELLTRARESFSTAEEFFQILFSK